MQIKKVIITGPTGAVGTALIQELINNNIQVTAISRVGSRRITNIPSSPLVSIVECNLNDLLSLSEKLTHDYDVFYHFGWDGTYGASRQDLYKQSENIKFALDAVELAHNIGCRVFIGAGSQSEYGHVDGVLTPNTACNPDNGYGICKLASCNLTRVACSKYNIRHNWCRILSLYGPYDGEYTLISSLIKSFIKGERIKTTNGDQIWDFIYSKDAAKAFRLVAENGIDNAVYCFGSGKTRTLKQYIIAVRDIVNPQCEIGFGKLPYYPNQVMHLEADISNLQNDTGFSPSYTFEEGIKETAEYFKSIIKE